MEKSKESEINEKIWKESFDVDEVLLDGMSGNLSHDEIDKLPKKYDEYKEAFHGWRSCSNPEFMNYSRFKTTMKLMKIYASLACSSKYKRGLFYMNPLNYLRAYWNDCKMRKEYKRIDILEIDKSELKCDNLYILSNTIIDSLVSALRKFMKINAVPFINDEYAFVGKYERPNYTTVFRISNRPCVPDDIVEYVTEANVNDDENVRFVSIVISFQEERSEILGEYIFSSEEIERNGLVDKLVCGCKELLLGELVEVCGRKPENEETV